jgi:hypothetical protein
MRQKAPTPVLLRTARGLILVALAVFVLLACRADEGLVGPVSLRVSPQDTLLEPGRTLHLAGTDLEGIRVRIAGYKARVVRQSPASLEVEIPESLFAPCLRSGVDYPVELRRGRQRKHFSLRAAAVPYRVSLSPGEHVLATAAVARGCAVEVADSGLYLAMPFSWEEGNRLALHLDTVRAQVTILPEDRPLPRKMLTSQRVLPRRPTRLVERPDPDQYRQLASLPTVNYLEPNAWDTLVPVETSCSAFPVIGDSMLLATARGSNGRFEGLHGSNRRAEYWKVVGSSTHLVVLFDRPTLLKARRIPAVRERLLEFLNEYESAVTPFFREALPHWQRQSRIPVLVTDSSSAPARGFAYPSWETGNTCNGRPTRSDFIWLDGTALFRPTPAREARMLSTAAHETAHLADFAFQRNPARSTPRKEWTVEGYADVLRHLWTLQGAERPFTSNMGKSANMVTAKGAPLYSLCGLNQDRPRPRAVSGEIDYPLACRMVSSLIARAVEAGQSETSALERFSALSSRRTFTQISNDLLGERRSPNQVVGEWLLSWYADELPGASAAIQDPMWDLRRFFPSSVLVDARVSPRGGVSSLILEELDARYLELEISSPTQIAYTQPGGSPLSVTRTDMALLRVR